MDYQSLKREVLEIADAIKTLPEALQNRVFDVLMSYLDPGRFSTQVPLRPPPKVSVTEHGDSTSEEACKPVKRPRKAATKVAPNFDRDLNLRGGNGRPSFEEFVGQKKPADNYEFNAVAVYYLHEIVGVLPVTWDHVYTCYRHAGWKLPKNFGQCLRDTARRRGYLDASNRKDLRLLSPGINLVERGLPRKKDGSVEPL